MGTAGGVESLCWVSGWPGCIGEGESDRLAKGRKLAWGAGLAGVCG